MRAKISDRVGGVKVHKRPASAILVEPNELWPGYEVNTLDEYQGKQHVWTKIYYIFNGAPYMGWVIREALDVEIPPTPPDVPKLDPSPPHIPSFEFKFFRNNTEAAVTVAVVLLAIAIVAWAFM